jgi:hypothetical protein
MINKVINLNDDLGIINICSGKGTTIKNFVKENLRFKKNLKKINMKAANPNKFEPKAFWGNSTKQNKLLLN